MLSPTTAPGSASPAGERRDWGLAYDRHLVTKLAGADVAGDHEAGTDADPHGDVDARRGAPGVQRLHRLDDLQARLHRARVVLVTRG